MNGISVRREERNLIMRALHSFIQNRSYWLMMLPGIIFYLVFCYLPIYGVQIAFRDYAFSKGIWHSDWVGLRNFQDLLRIKKFWVSVQNTFIISAGRLVFEFPFPILLAILLNEVRNKPGKRFLQTIYTFPHFISWVVAFGIFFSFLSTDGIVNRVITLLGSKPVGFFTDPKIFRPLLYASDLWKSMGWSSIIYLAAITSVSPEVMEAAIVDGANRFQRIVYVVLPGIMPVIAIMLILNLGNAMNAGFDQIFNLYSPNVYDVADIVDTYVYRMSFRSSGSFSLSAAAGLLKSVINLVFLLTADRVVRVFGQQGIWR